VTGEIRPNQGQPPKDADAFLAWMKSVNAQVMQQRPDKQWHDATN
jgi:hypothetical protein